MLSNLPQAEEAKSNTLKTVLGKILARFECPIDPSKITLPIAGGKIVGCCFLEYDDEELAKVAVSKVNGFQLDKQHKLIASSFEEIERLS